MKKFMQLRRIIQGSLLISLILKSQLISNGCIKTKYKKKNGEADRFKARLVAKCHKQNPSIDHVEFLHMLLDLTLFIWLSLVLHNIIGKIFKYM